MTKMIDAQIQSKWFQRIRQAHLSETIEDYVELIADLINTQGEARLSDLALRFGVSHPTVNKTLKRLQELDYVQTKPYRAIFLTEKGKRLAKKCKQRHEIILKFLISLGVSPETAEYDAEGIEHHVSQETLKIFKKFLSKNQGKK